MKFAILQRSVMTESDFHPYMIKHVLRGLPCANLTYWKEPSVACNA